MADTALMGLDWGTTQLRAYRFVAGGRVVESRELPLGISRVAPGAAGFERAFDAACGDWLRASPTSALLACGMIGSAQGWREAPYLDVPTTSDAALALGRALTALSTPGGPVLHIVPGLIQRGPLPDVMRGEETQIAGALAQPGGPSGPDTWLVLPGSHAKWVRVCDRQIVQFRTFMTGEVYAALCAHTILGRTMQRAPAFDDQAFDRGVELARSPSGRAGVLSTIFTTRTLGLVGALSADAQPDYLSGLLIGHEIAALDALGEVPGAIVLIGSDELCQRYRRALAAFGRPPAIIASGATERGLWRIAAAAGLVGESTAC